MKGQNNSSFSSVFAISFIISISILLLIGSLSYKQIKSQYETQNLVNHAYNVQILLEQLFSLSKDSETGQRGYIITNDAVFLESYVHSRYQIDSIYNELQLLSKDNKEQQKNLDSLKQIINLRFNLLDKRIKEFDANATKNSESTKAKMLVGKNTMDLLRYHLNKMITIETKLLNKHQKTSKATLSFTPLFFLLLFIFSIILFIAGFYKTNKNLKNLEQVNDKLTLAKIELEDKNKEYIFQNEEKQKRADELIIANKELVIQNIEKEKKASELIIANKAVVFEFIEKEKRAAELIIANNELAFQNEEKEKRAAELMIANKELAFQNEEKEKRATELIMANKELSAFNYISSHDLQEPLRKIQVFISRIFDDETLELSEKNKDYFKRMQSSANRMQILIDDLLAYSRLNITDIVFEKIIIDKIVEEVVQELSLAQNIEEKNAIINYAKLPKIQGIPFQLKQLFTNLIINSLKYSEPNKAPVIDIKSTIINGIDVLDNRADKNKRYHKITIADNGIGFEQQYAEKIFTLFQRLHDKQTFSGTGIGLAICKKIVENHQGFIVATGVPNQGATFNIYLPVA